MSGSAASGPTSSRPADRSEAAPPSYPGGELDALEASPNYYAWILRHFMPHLRGRVLELGAGIGTVAGHLRRHPAVSDLILVEPADNLFPRLAARFADQDRVTVVHGRLQDVAETIRVDAVITVNVLEHVENDVALLRAAHRLLAPDGAVLLFVPALPWLYGTLDESFGHVRRYTRPGLVGRLTQAGFRIETLRYFNCPGVGPWLVAGRILRRRTIRAGDARAYDRWVVPWASRLEQRWAPPFGQSLLAVARARGW
jgi:SAM-dependent methyltransferase